MGSGFCDVWALTELPNAKIHSFKPNRFVVGPVPVLSCALVFQMFKDLYFQETDTDEMETLDMLLRTSNRAALQSFSSLWIFFRFVLIFV